MTIYDTRDGRKERGQLRTRVLQLGELLGWRPCEVIAFTEAVANREWQHCGREEFEAVLEEYRAIGQIIQAKVEKRANRAAQDSQRERGHYAPFE